MIRSIKRCFFLATLGLLGGCVDGADEVWIDYHETLAQALDAAPIERQAPENIGAFVDRRERLIAIPEVRESMLNVYALRECNITSLVAARNNQLGRVAPPSQHWLYERTLWQRLTRCTEGDIVGSLGAEDRARLEALTALKTEQLPAVGWNALFDSEEWEKNFSRASDPLDPRDLPDPAAALAALDYLTTMVERTYSLSWQADSATLEGHLKVLQRRPLVAEVLRSLQLGYTRLNEANRLLARHLESNQCLPAWETAALDELTALSRRVLSAVNALIAAHEVTPPSAVVAYQRRWLSLEEAAAPWERFQAARLEHTVLRAHFPRCAAG
ncbi:DUF3080 family protein [Vreelandella malpeensis]|uniref:DUF3080 family protein n=1 Tax=Vreelandella malpeensis TaxID=1172368 RepID=A0ABS8DVP6_9GAMM|nr:DUF3080 family protein [Halomonas malpeensis]MCB8890128.1 DUF3080 family protein [Halomonas malpeensis]